MNSIEETMAALINLVIVGPFLGLIAIKIMVSEHRPGDFDLKRINRYDDRFPLFAALIVMNFCAICICAIHMGGTCLSER